MRADRPPKVVNLRGGAYHPNAVYIGRPSKWGNPFVIGEDGPRSVVIEMYRAYLDANPDLKAAARQELRGRDLACYCAPAACHGDVLLEIANAL